MNRIFQIVSPIATKLFIKPAIKLSKSLKELKEDIRYLKIPILFEEYIASSIFISVILSTLAFIGIVIALKVILGRIDWVLLVLSIVYAIIVFNLALTYFLSYPKLAKSDYKKSLEDNLPLALIYLAGLSKSGLGVLEAFEVLSKRKEFGAVSDEAKYIVLLTKKLGVDMLTALIEASKKTPSEEFREFLYSLISTIRGGGDLSKTIEAFAKDSLFNYRLRLKEYEEKVSLLLTIYTFIFIAFPLTFLILAFLFSYAAGNTSILTSLSTFFLGFLPMAYAVYLYIVYLIQPSL